MYEIILKYKRYKRIIIFLITFFFILISLLFSRSFFYGGILVIALSIVPLSQITSKLIENEEKIEERFLSNKNIFIRHKDFIIDYFVIFFSSLIAFYIGYLLFPNIFYPQIQAINNLKQEVSSLNNYSGASIDSNALFSFIILNNLKILILFYVFSFLYGAGSIYLLLWNSSIIGVYIGMNVYELNTKDILYKYLIYPLILSIQIFPHGIIEFFAYFLSALSGGIFSHIFFIKNKNRKVIEQIASDSLLLFMFSILFLFIAALVEAYII